MLTCHYKGCLFLLSLQMKSPVSISWHIAIWISVRTSLLTHFHFEWLVSFLFASGSDFWGQISISILKCGWWWKRIKRCVREDESFKEKIFWQLSSSAQGMGGHIPSDNQLRKSKAKAPGYCYLGFSFWWDTKVTPAILGNVCCYTLWCWKVETILVSNWGLKSENQVLLT